MRLKLDYILFFIIFICSYFNMGMWGVFSSFLPIVNLVGYDFICFLLAGILFLFSMRKGYRIKNKSLYCCVLIATFYSVYKFVETSFFYGFSESITIYRKIFIQLPTFALCYRYISNMSSVRIEQFVQWMKKWIIPLSVLYFLQCAGIPLFSRVQSQTVDGISVVRNILGMPPIVPIIFTLVWVALLDDKNRKNIIYASLCFCVVFISFTRNLFGTAILICFCSTFMYVCKYGIKDNYKLVGYVVSGILLIALLLPNALNFWGSLIDDTFNNQLKNNQGTYAFREKLIEQVIDSNNMLEKSLTGQGYIRDVKKGEYSMVLGTDTFVAPILWCEGYVGMIARTLIPLCIALITFSIYCRSRDRKSILSAIVIVSVIIVQIPNYVQTEIFMRFNHTVPLTYMLLRYAQISHLNRKKINYA